MADGRDVSGLAYPVNCTRSDFGELPLTVNNSLTSWHMGLLAGVSEHIIPFVFLFILA